MQDPVKYCGKIFSVMEQIIDCFSKTRGFIPWLNQFKAQMQSKVYFHADANAGFTYQTNSTFHHRIIYLLVSIS